MRIVQDDRLEEFRLIEHLLYGINYEVWFNLYGPCDSDIGLVEALRKLISNKCEITGAYPSSPKEAKSEIMDRVLYEGDTGSGPLKLDKKKAEIIELMNSIFSVVDLDKAEMVSEFGFRKGNPSYPVFWDFAYDIHSKGQRWILVGSSSD
ncbi:MAG: hypothetical protein KUG78_10750 [Kangiellaceae bacterium]|nr:hypothetical protein [Kangiellaceae bacterium]